MKLKHSKNIFNALADETRLRILNLLNEGELCVCDLMQVLKEPQSKISRHLAYLRQAGWVQGRKEGLWMHYRLTHPASKLYGKVLQAVCGCRPEMEELQADLKVLHKNKSGLVGCCE